MNFDQELLWTAGELWSMRQNKFPTALLLSPEAGLAADIQTALRSFGLKKLTLLKDSKQLNEQIVRQGFALVLVDVDCLQESERTATLEKLAKIKSSSKEGLMVAIARIRAREDIVALRESGFATVLIKPLSVVMMEQAFSELIERERTLPVNREALRQLHELFLRGGIFEAERTLSIWLEKEPSSLEALTLQALQFLKKQEFYRANASVSKALQIKSDHLPALQLRTRISLRLGQLNAAMDSLTKEEKVVARFEAKLLHEPAHQLLPAEEMELSFSEDFDTREGVTALLNNLALQLSKTGHAEDALALYRRALGPLEIPEWRFVTLYNRARLYIKLKRHEEAAHDLNEAKKLAPAEMSQKMAELLTLCASQIVPSALERLNENKHRPVTITTVDRLDDKPISKPAPRYRKFNREEVLKLVFLGKMEESTVPPESVSEWLQMKKNIMHILFLTKLPSVQEHRAEPVPRPEQGAL